MKTDFGKHVRAPLAAWSSAIAGVMLGCAAHAQTSVDCTRIWQRSGSGWYESNPTYQDARNDSADWVISTPAAEGMDAALLDQGVDAVKNSTLRSVLVIRNNKLVYERYLNGGTKNASNNIHSASKSLLRMLVGIAIQQGYIANLDVKVSTILPEYFNGASTAKKNITIRHLLTMSAGLSWKEDETEYTIETAQNWVQAIIARSQPNSPGTKFNYSTGLTHVLSAVLQRKTGMSTCDFAHQYLLNSMNITAEHWGKDPNGIYSGGYNVYMTAREMAKLGLLWINRGNWNGQQLVPASVIDEAQQLTFVDDETFSYGQLFWRRKILGHDMFFAWGYGGQFIYMIPDLNIVLVTSQSTAGADGEINSGEFIENYLIPSADGGGTCLRR